MEDFQSLHINSLDDDYEEKEFKVKEQEDDNEEDDDEEDEDAEDEPVTLGFLEETKNPVLLLRQVFPSKAGGVPAWLNPVDLPSLKSYTCGFCAEPLQFLLQVYAPLSGNESSFHRTLFVFMCPSMSCLFKDQHEQWQHRADNPTRSVKVFRCQLPRINAFYPSEPPKYDGFDKPSNPGAPLCSWCGSWKGEKVCSRCKKARYCSEKHQVLHWKAEHKTECVQAVTLSQCSTSITQKNFSTSIRAACKTLWPEYEIAIEDESRSEEASNDSNFSNALVIKEQKSDESFQALSDRFEADDDKKSWASFQERIAEAPHQVLRYCRDVNAKPLWPVTTGRPTKDDIPKCSYCGAPMCYEFQILPQLLYYFKVKNDPDSLDWATVVVYACEASCEGSVAYKEEFAWIQLYSATSV